MKSERKKKSINLANLSKEDLAKLKVDHCHWLKTIEPLLKGVRESERITAADLSITINAGRYD
jgi:hypothetical protein